MVRGSDENNIWKGNCEHLKGVYSKWWERLQQSYENRNMYGHEVQTANWSQTNANYETERNVSAGSVSKQVHWWIC